MPSWIKPGQNFATGGFMSGFKYALSMIPFTSIALGLMLFALIPF